MDQLVRTSSIVFCARREVAGGAAPDVLAAAAFGPEVLAGAPPLPLVVAAPPKIPGLGPLFAPLAGKAKLGTEVPVVAVVKSGPAPVLAGWLVVPKRPPLPPVELPGG